MSRRGSTQAQRPADISWGCLHPAVQVNVGSEDGFAASNPSQPPSASGRPLVPRDWLRRAGMLWTAVIRPWVIAGDALSRWAGAFEDSCRPRPDGNSGRLRRSPQRCHAGGGGLQQPLGDDGFPVPAPTRRRKALRTRPRAGIAAGFGKRRPVCVRQQLGRDFRLYSGNGFEPCRSGATVSPLHAISSLNGRIRDLRLY